ncbi:MAG TPA: SpoIID/LytB domain-containing protein [Firmicutes bacterium]|jgi:stage II sporulation protein D|nr:SpoIID/LytB domain-containing protein [Bacillota bacterium]
MVNSKAIKNVLVLCLVVAIIAIAGILPPINYAYAGESAGYSESEPEILVGLSRCTHVSLVFSDSYQVFADGLSVQVSTQDTVTFELVNGKIAITESASSDISWSAQTPGPVIITPLPEKNGHFTVVKEKNPNSNLTGRSFRGTAVIMADGGNLVVANLLGMEEYLWSVVSCEIPNLWTGEVLKTQAVASRTYALYKTCSPGGSSEISNRALVHRRTLGPEDIRIWATDQIYRGMTYEDPRVIEACVSTRGQILTYLGKPAAAYFHSDASGMTEDSRFVWGGAIPYLTGVEEVPHSSPYSQWEVSFDPDTVAQKMAWAGMAGPIRMITGVDPGVSGRWFGVNLDSGNGNLRIKGNEFRLIMDLRSLLFSVFRKGGNLETLGCLSPGLQVSVDNGNGIQSVPLRTCIVAGAGRESAAGNGAFAVSSSVDGPLTFVFQGRGWGHGVGLSQWGAKAMAEQGADFRQILIHYYPGTNIEQWW